MAYRISLTFTLAIVSNLSSAAWAMGSPAPASDAPSSPTIPVVPAPPSLREFRVNGLVSIKSNFGLGTLTLPKLTPACLKKNNYQLIALDPGHDDSANSRRSDAKVRGGNGKFVFLWPKVHEGQLTMAVSLMAYHYITSNPALTATEKKEISQMVRLSRYPGERRFGEYEIEAGYNSSSVGTIDAGVSNRQARVNQMLRKHRAPASTGTGWSSTATNVQEKSIFLSVHANSTDYFDEGDFAWMIPPNTTSIPTLTTAFQNALASGFGLQMVAGLKPQASDDDDVAALKSSIYKNFETAKVRKVKREGGLAMLSTALGTAKTLKVLSEGFVMNGKAGHVAHIELNSGTPRTLQAFRGNSEVFEYGYTSVYDAYARSIAAGLASQLKCE